MKLLGAILQASIAVVTVWLLCLHAADAVPLSMTQILIPAAGLGLLVSLCSAVDLFMASLIVVTRLANRRDARLQRTDKRDRQLRRRGLVLFLCCVGLSCPLFAADPQKPVLLVIHSDQCPPCRVFDKVYTIDAELRTALHRAFDVRELDLGVPSQRLQAEQLGVSEVPTFVVQRNGKTVSTHRGFAATMEVRAVNRAIADLMDDLQVEWPLPKLHPPAKRIEPSRPAPAPAPIASLEHPGPVVDQVARDGITKLATQTRELATSQQQTQQRVDSISADVRQLRDEVTQSHNDLRSQIESGSGAVRELRDHVTESNTASRTQLETISKTLQQSIESTRSSTREELETIIRGRIESVEASKVPADISTEIRAASESRDSSPGPTASKWLRVLAWAGKTGLAIAAPEVAIPGSIALTVAGLGVSWIQKRRRPKPLGSIENPIRVADPAEVRTETKYVVSESDVVGEAYKEAIRRVGNAHRESNPTIISVLKQVDAAAGQLAHGKRIERRPANAPVSENEP